MISLNENISEKHGKLSSMNISNKTKKARKNLSFVYFSRKKNAFFCLYPAVDDELERFESCRTGIRDGRLPLHFHNRIVLNGIFYLKKGRERIESFDYYVNSL